MSKQIEVLEEHAARARERVARLEVRLDSWQSACRSDPAITPLRQELAEAENNLLAIEDKIRRLKGPMLVADLNPLKLSVNPFVLLPQLDPEEVDNAVSK